MALYTVSGVITDVKLLIEQANDVNIVTEDELIILVNKVQKWVAAESGCYQAWSTLTLTANTLRYAPPASTSGVLTLQYNYGGDIGMRDLKRIDPDNVPYAPDNVYPYYWHYRGNYVSIYPSLPVVPPTASVDILVAKLPDAVTALTTALSIPDEFQVVIPYRVAYDVAIKDSQFTLAQFLDTKIKELVKVGMAQYAHQAGGLSGSAQGGGGGATS